MSHPPRVAELRAKHLGASIRPLVCAMKAELAGLIPHASCSAKDRLIASPASFHPDLFARLITCPGTFIDQQDDDAPEDAMSPLGAWDYHDGKVLDLTMADTLVWAWRGWPVS